MYMVLSRIFSQRFCLVALFFIFTFQFFEAEAEATSPCAQVVSGTGPYIVVGTNNALRALRHVMGAVSIKLSQHLAAAGINNQMVITAQITKPKGPNKPTQPPALSEYLLRFSVFHSVDLSPQAMNVIKYYLLNVVKAMLTPMGTLDQVQVLTLNQLSDYLLQVQADVINDVVEKAIINIKRQIDLEGLLNFEIAFQQHSLPPLGLGALQGDHQHVMNYINNVIGGGMNEGETAPIVGVVLRPQQQSGGAIAYSVVVGP
ncbi:MAG: hypothetical protein K1X29_02570 [Bdellovibrionales bacterium]|nr:hypothetical protein [Bdellovibrionales bacterium]